MSIRSRIKSSELRGALRTGHLVRFTRRFEATRISGYVLDVGREFFLLAPVGDQIRFNGLQAMRIRDLRGLQDDPFAAFVQAALKMRRERRPRKRKLSVRTLPDLLQAAAKAFPLITIHREEVAPAICQIGHLLGVSKGRLRMLEIGPGAVWDKVPTEYALKQVTRVDFGGGYEEALSLVGGRSPTG